MSDKQTQTTLKTPKQIEQSLLEKADELLMYIDLTIKKVFPTNEYRKVMWIAVHERVKARIDACSN